MELAAFDRRWRWQAIQGSMFHGRLPTANLPANVAAGTPAVPKSAAAHPNPHRPAAAHSGSAARSELPSHSGAATRAVVLGGQYILSAHV